MVTYSIPKISLAIIAIITGLGLIMATTASAQAPVDISGNTPATPTNNQPLLLGCKDGLALFKPQSVQSPLGLQMGCLVKPFNIKAFNGTKVLNDGNISSTGNVSSDICHTIFNGVHGLFIKDASGAFKKFLCSSLTPK